MDGQGEGNIDVTMPPQANLRVKMVEAGMDSFEAEGAESTVMHLLHEFQTRVDTRRATEISTLERLSELRGGGPGLTRPSLQ
jgi:hypothetical protein